MKSVEEALEIILSGVKSVGEEEVPLADVVGRTLREDVAADSDIPFSDNSAMDGYAVRAADVAGATDEAPARLRVLEDVPAGRIPTKAVGEGAASRIMTGAPVPEGADAVVMVENTEPADDGVLVRRAAASGENIRRAGEDIRGGEIVLPAGRTLCAADVGLLASAGRSVVRVSRRPVVGIIATGDEVVEPETEPGPGVVRNSNSYTLIAKCIEVGASPLYFGIARDSAEALERVFREAAATADMVVTTGGVSVGDYDFVKDVLDRLGDIKFWKVKIKPGKPMAFGSMLGVPLFGLPGNPVSTAVSFEMFVRPALLRMMGSAERARPLVPAIADEAIREKAGRHKIIRGVAVWRGGRLHARTTGSQGSGVLTSMRDANCFIHIDSERGAVAPGETVPVELLRLPDVVEAD